MLTDPTLPLQVIQHELDERYEIALQDLDVLAATAWHDTGLESLALMELVLHLETLFGVSISNADLAHVVTFGDLAAFFAAEGELA